MDQLTNTLPVASPQPSFPKWPIIALFSFLLGIAFILAYQKYLPSGSDPVGPSSTPEVSVLPLPSVDPTANWQTYTNNNLGFSFRYPQEWFIEESGNNEFQQIRLQNYDPVTAPGRGYDSTQDANKTGMVFLLSKIQALNINSLIQQLPQGQECMFIGDVLGLRIYQNRQQKIINNFPALMQESGCSEDFQKTKTEEIFFLDQKGKVVNIGLILNTQLIKNNLDLILSTFKFLGESSMPELLNIKFNGGLCPDGNACSSTKTIMQNGSVLINNKLKTKTDLTKLTSLINTVNFDEIRSKKFTGTCPTAYDGQEAIYTFYTSTGAQTISSCEFEIDNQSLLFSEINQIFSNLPNEK